MTRPSWEWPTVLTGTALFAAGFWARGLVAAKYNPRVIESPRRKLLSTLSETERSKLPYPLDVLPGARDVDTPYGTIRVYEWGPEDGRKVLFVHGISTPCLSLGAVAHSLADHGCRVMLFDLFGRGYSDNPVDVQQDMRLFSTQILLVLASSPLAWTGNSSGGFSLVGYSLGGGICMDFTYYFPLLVRSLILVAPSGIIRPSHITYTNKIIYSEGLVPEPVLIRILRQRLQRPIAPQKPANTHKEKPDVTDAVKAEVSRTDPGRPVATLSRRYPHITIEETVAHQLAHHEGFVPAFISSIRHGPIIREREKWKAVGKRLSQQNQVADGATGLREGKVLIISGATDPLILRHELEPDATQLLEGNVQFHFIEGGHEVPVTKGPEVAGLISEFWS